MVTTHSQEGSQSATMNDMKEIPYSPANLKYVREKVLDVSRLDVQKATGINQATIYKYESGLKNPTVTKLEKIGAYFSRVAGEKVKFICEWDEREKEEFIDKALYQSRIDAALARKEADSTED
jgi:transcriptional regulator with XRE-family HTH domain